MAIPTATGSADSQSNSSDSTSIIDPGQLLDATGAEAAFEEFWPDAQAVGLGSILRFHADAPLALHNIRIGAKALEGHEDKIRQELPAINIVHLLSLPRLGLALIFAVAMVNRKLAQQRKASELLAKARPLRTIMLGTAEMLVHAKLLPAEPVKKIRQGRGTLDTATDLIELAALYRKHARELQGHSPITPDRIQDDSTIGTQLMDVVKPIRATKVSDMPEALRTALETRDRYWTLVVQRHELLRRVAYWLWGDESEKHVPALRHREAPPKKKNTKGPGTTAGQANNQAAGAPATPAAAGTATAQAAQPTKGKGKKGRKGKTQGNGQGQQAQAGTTPPASAPAQPTQPQLPATPPAPQPAQPQMPAAPAAPQLPAPAPTPAASGAGAGGNGAGSGTP